MEEISSYSSAKLNFLLLISIFPVSILDISRISLIRDSRYLDEASIFRKQSWTLGVSSIFICPMVLIPIMAFMGVLISWLILDRKSDLALFAALAAASASRKSCSCLACSALWLSSTFTSSMASTSVPTGLSTQISCMDIQWYFPSWPFSCISM